MDIVDTFNHLIPSDQLDDSLIIGQNLECEASNDFGSGLQLEDSLKNMLSDKDPMFGCATTQFNLLDNEDSTFQISGEAGLDDGSASTGLSKELTVTRPTQFKRPVGRPRKRPHNVEIEQEPANTSSNSVNSSRPGGKPATRLQKSFLIEKGVKGPQLKKELISGGRININELEGRLWLKPSVVLRRLTVTIGGFRIELLPGPSYVQSADSGYDSSFGFAMLPDDSVSVLNAVPENATGVDVVEKCCAEDTPLGLGPYVNPNEVQTTNGTEGGRPCLREKEVGNHNVSGKEKPVSNNNDDKKDDIKQPQHNDNNRATARNEMDVKETQQTAKNLLKSKSGLTTVKNKGLVPCKPSNVMKGSKVSQNMPSRPIQRGDLHKLKTLKDKKDNEPSKRPAETPHPEHPSKVQKIQGAADLKVKPKLPSTPSSAAKKPPSSGSRAADQQSPAKLPHSLSSKAETANPAHGRPGPSLKTPPEAGHEKAKVKKPEKLLHRQKSKTARSISVDEPQLFVPDNAPVVKRESVEEQHENNEAVWDGNNCCGLCKKHHNNMFMVGCGRCDDWFHGDCVGLDLTKVREMEEEDEMYVCLKCCEEESKKVEPETPRAAAPESQTKTEAQDHKLAAKPGPTQTLTSGGVRPVRKESDRRQHTETAHKTGIQLKLETKSKTASKKPVSVEEIRRSVRDSLKEILIQRLKESDLNVSVERACEVAKKTERELFHLYKDTENKYKNKYRSLMFNLKDTKNNVLFKRVLKGEISPSSLIRMSPEELASKELAAWRQRENRHTIEMIEKEQREAERRPITKITHKGEIEIESQEPVKAPEPAELEPADRVTEVSAEPLKTPEKSSEGTETDKDTTNQHKSHLFDLHCKICTGHMAPPVIEPPTKVVKVATTVVRRQSTKSEEGKSSAPTAAEEELHLTVLEESFRKSQTGYDGRSEHTPGRDEEASFLSSLKSLWRGFIHMHAVAKLVTKAFPVSGILDNLIQDLPDSIQVGGRISPQTVWDYLEKIRATGTKEVCLIRFAPETEEDEISYTLLYAYFSSRKRFGVVSNNRKQVKDMYLIPLGATEKVPHQLVPFDGPGLENNRSNLLLGLIIRQRPKRDFLPVGMNETSRISPEIRPVPISTKDPQAAEEEEKLYLSSLTAAHKAEKSRPPDAAEEVHEPVTDSFEEPSASEEPTHPESQKPLRFLPGVLVGWGGELPPLPDFGGKSLTTADDTQKTHSALKPEASTSGIPKSPKAAAPRERFVIKKKEVKPVKVQPELSSQTNTSAAIRPSGKDAAAAPQSTSLSLKDKPPDVSTEAFLASLSTTQGETSSATSTDKSADVILSGTETAKPEPQTASDHTNSLKPPLSGILKKSSAYSSVTEDKTTALQRDNTNHTALVDSKPAPPLSKNNPVTPFHQGFLQISRVAERTAEKKQTAIESLSSEQEDLSMSQDGDVVQAPPSATDSGTDLSLPAHNSTAAVVLQQPQVPGSSDDPAAPPPNTLHNPHVQDQNHGTSWAQDGASHAPAGLQSPSEPPSLTRDSKQQREEPYSQSWDREHHGKAAGPHRESHHSKKSRHHDRAREKKHDHRHDDKYRERSRHHSHSEDRHGDRRWKERVHSDDSSNRHKDRHRHRRDSDYENERRSSRESYS